MANSRAYEDFSRRLKQALREAGEGDGPTHLARQFNERYSGKSVTQQAVRKWLYGEALPAHDKIQALARWLGVRPDWLEYGAAAGEGGHAAQQVTTAYRSVLSDQELVRYYHKLNRSQQQALAEIIAALAAKDRRR